MSKRYTTENTYVGHGMPDLDCALVLWLLTQFLTAPDEIVRHKNVPHEAGGKSCPPHYLVVDTGGGQIDHHPCPPGP